MLTTITPTAEPSSRFHKRTHDSTANQPLASTSTTVPVDTQSAPATTSPAIPVNTQTIPATASISNTSSQPRSSETISDGEDHGHRKKPRTVR